VQAPERFQGQGRLSRFLLDVASLPNPTLVPVLGQMGGGDGAASRALALRATV
jgi:hypothetical protein